MWVPPQQFSSWRAVDTAGGWGWCWEKGAGFSFAVCIFIIVSYENSIGRVFHKALPSVAFSLPQHAFGCVPLKIRGLSIFDSSVRLSGLFVLFFPAVKTQSASVCVAAFISVFLEPRCAFLLQDMSHEAVGSLEKLLGLDRACKWLENHLVCLMLWAYGFRRVFLFRRSC